MSQILEAEAVIRARDLTGRVFEAVAGKVKTVSLAMRQAERASAVMARAGERALVVSRAVESHGKAMTIGVTVPAALAARSVYKTVHDFELAGNKLKAFGDLSEEEVARAKKIATEYGQKYQFGPTGVLQGMVEQIKAGFDPRSIKDIQKPILDFATVAEIDVPRASELAIYAIAGFGKMYDKTGQILEGSALNKNLREMVDLFAILNKAAPGSIGQIADTFKYVAPIAKNIGVTPDQAGAFTAVLAQAGILGSEAGTALRSMMVRFIKPTIGGKAAMNAAGLRFGDYVDIDTSLLKPESILSAVENFSGKAAGKNRGKFSVGKAPPAARALFLKRVAALEGLEGDDYVKGLTDVIRKTVGGGLADAKIAGDLANRIVGTAVKRIDVMKFLKDAFEHAPNLATLFTQFFDQKQGGRLSNLEIARIVAVLNAIVGEYEKARQNGSSPSAVQADIMNSGLIEAENRIRGSIERLKIAFADPAILEPVIKTFESIASALKAIGEMNPAVLQAGVYAATAAAVWGPAALILGRLAKLGGLLVKGGGWLLPVVAKPSMGGATAGIALSTLEAIKRDAETDNSIRSGLRSFLGIDDPKEPAPWMPGGDWNRAQSTQGAMSPLTIEGIRSAVDSRELKGTVQVETTVKVEPSPDFLSRAYSRVRAMFGPGIRTEGDGSTGTSMPEAAPGAIP